MIELIGYCRGCIDYCEQKIMSLDEKKVSLTDEEQLEVDEIIECIQNQILAYTDILNKVIKTNKSMYERQCKYCRHFSFRKGVACCKGCPMDEDLFCIGMYCNMFNENQ